MVDPIMIVHETTLNGKTVVFASYERVVAKL